MFWILQIVFTPVKARNNSRNSKHELRKISCQLKKDEQFAKKL